MPSYAIFQHHLIHLIISPVSLLKIFSGQSKRSSRISVTDRFRKRIIYYNITKRNSLFSIYNLRCCSQLQTKQRIKTIKSITCGIVTVMMSLIHDYNQVFLLSEEIHKRLPEPIIRRIYLSFVISAIKLLGIENIDIDWT